MHPRIPLIGALAPVLMLVALLAGCGSTAGSSSGIASKTPAGILAAAKAAAAGAASAHVKGSIVSGGEPISLDMELVAGKGGKGRIALEGLSVELVGVDKAVYIKGSQAFYRRVAGAAAARQLRGHWLKATGKSGNFASLSSLTDLGRLIGSTLAAHGRISKAPSATIGGQRAVGVADESGGGTLYVAATGTPYPLEIVKKGHGGGTIVFNRWNEPVTIEPPSSSIYVNKLQRGR